MDGAFNTVCRGCASIVVSLAFITVPNHEHNGHKYCRPAGGRLCIIISARCFVDGESSDARVRSVAVDLAFCDGSWNAYGAVRTRSNVDPSTLLYVRTLDQPTELSGDVLSPPVSKKIKLRVP